MALYLSDENHQRDNDQQTSHGEIDNCYHLTVEQTASLYAARLMLRNCVFQMAEHKACQVVRRHLLGVTWPPVPVSNEDLQQLTNSSESPSPSALLDLAEAASRSLAFFTN